MKGNKGSRKYNYISLPVNSTLSNYYYERTSTISPILQSKHLHEQVFFCTNIFYSTIFSDIPDLGLSNEKLNLPFWTLILYLCLV